jgi:hypothetical protein
MLVHHATILEIDGESVRTKKAKSQQTALGSPPQPHTEGLMSDGKL